MKERNAVRINGVHGVAWEYDEILRRELCIKAGRTAEQIAYDPMCGLWVVDVPWAHPHFHSYVISVYHLRPIPNGKPVRFYVEGATHEFVVFVLDPEWDEKQEPNPAAAILNPANFAAQFIEPGDIEAYTRVRADVVDIISGKLSPDTDYAQCWIKRYGAGMVKGDKDRVGETKIIINGKERSDQLIYDPKAADAMPDLNPPWTKA